MTLALTSDSLELLHVRKRYAQSDGRQPALDVLDDISLQVRGGEFVSIVGASGCGKSTLLRLIAGLDVDYEGEIRAGGERVRDTSLQRGIVFQDHRLFPWLTVAQNGRRCAIRRSMPARGARRWPSTSRWSAWRDSRRPIRASSRAAWRSAWRSRAGW